MSNIHVMFHVSHCMICYTVRFVLLNILMIDKPSYVAWDEVSLTVAGLRFSELSDVSLYEVSLTVVCLRFTELSDVA